MTQERFPVFATRMNYKIIEARLKGARVGHNLLNTKSGALKTHYRKLEEELSRSNEDIEVLFQKAFLTLSRAEFYGANADIFKKKCSKMNVGVETTVDQVCGLMLPKFKLVYSKAQLEETLSRGGSKLMEAKTQFDKLLSLLVEVSSLKSSFETIKETLDVTNRRVNALEHVLIPKLENTLYFIGNELDEQERENFYKLKKVQKLRKVD